MNVARETVWLAAVCTIDMVVTAILVSTGRFTEANPLLGHYLRYGLGAMCGVKLVSYLVPLAIAEWQRRREPRFVRAVLRAALGLYIVGYFTGIAAVNLPLISF